MKELAIGTNNPDKLRELRRLLRGFGIRVRPIGDYGAVPAVHEDGRTFEANAGKKARVYSKVSRCLTLADDSGLCVPSLNNRPGVYSARFAGPGCTYNDNNRKLLRLLAGKRGRKRNAYFVCAAALYDNGRRVRVLRGTAEGRIAEAPRGDNGFGYDPVFVPDGLKKTFAELPAARKHRLSHRGKALRQVRQFLKKYFKKY